MKYILNFTIMYLLVIAVQTAFTFLLDLILMIFRFLLTADFSSVVQHAINNPITGVHDEYPTLLFTQEIWQIETKFKGIDHIINSFLNLQYSVSGRWDLILISTVSLLIFFLLALKFDLNIFDTKKKIDTFFLHLGGYAAFVSLFPISVFLLIGLLTLIFS